MILTRFNHPKVKSSYKLDLTTKDVMAERISFNHPKVKSSYKHKDDYHEGKLGITKVSITLRWRALINP